MRFCLAGLPLTFAPALAFAQADSAEDEIFELSPFTVDGSKDVGYAAQNTLAGTRLNSELKDLASPMETFTKEFLEDIGADTLDDAMLYAVNAQEELGDDTSGFSQDYKQQSQVRTKFRIRGLPQTRARDFFEWNLPQDLYSVERLEQSRGPNSILFGLGSAGGVANTTSKQANVNRDRTNIRFKVGSWNLKRAQLDLNKVLVDEKLAVRFNLMTQDQDHWQQFRSHDKKGLQAALTYNVSKNTKLRSDFELGEMNDLTGRSFAPRSSGYYWDIAGRPTLGVADVMKPVNGAGRYQVDNGKRNAAWNDPAVDYRSDDSTHDRTVNFRNPNNLNTNRYTFVDGDSTFYDNVSSWTTRPIGGAYMLDESQADPSISINGPGAFRELDYESLSFFLEHRFNDDFFVELAYNERSHDWLSHNTGGGPLLEGDPNAEIFTKGTILENPNAGRFYYEDQWQRELRVNDNESFRITSSYELDTERFGQHRFAAMWSTADRFAQKTISDQVVLAGGATPEAGRYRLWTRHYFDDLSNPAEVHVPDWRDVPSSVTDPATGESFDIGWAPRIMNPNTVAIDSTLFAMQNFFFNRKLVTTYGYRKDDEEVIATRDFTRDPVTNFKVLDWSDPWAREADSSTHTFGAVYHVNDWLSLTYNRSSNGGLSQAGWQAPNLDEPLDVTANTGFNFGAPEAGTGSSEDFGVKMNLFENKVYLTANYFKTQGTGRLFWQSNYAGNLNSILNTLGNPAGIDLVNFETGEEIETIDPLFDRSTISMLNFTARTEDYEAEGYEVGLTANPTTNLKLRLGYSYGTRTTFDAFAPYREYNQRFREWVHGFVPAELMGQIPLAEWNSLSGNWAENEDQIVLGEDGIYRLSIDNVLDIGVDEWIDTQIENRQQKFGQRHHKFNVFAKYDFREGFLKGFGVGAGFRWQSGAEAGWLRRFEITNEELGTGAMVIDRDTVLKTDAITSNDLTLSYQRKVDFIKDGTQMRLQLVVRNVFDDTDYSRARYNVNHLGEEIPLHYYRPTPRQVTAEASFTF
ncbi:TonB-dependent siderophore receptor [Pelagicoccus mobilis]|uniref:TonB-dependent receptor plug domain-containing protein n=1 Tax=Pelagicoccus mobilis TaxID=415221 RepID=A0A934VPQ7_9BACT|nr:TonB-dependent receptor plug domain-containing protein [Pelagicoccus mobilis]MBK1876065.1 hypothetical protein [Pelagicoccus mobilis]